MKEFWQVNRRNIIRQYAAFMLVMFAIANVSIFYSFHTRHKFDLKQFLLVNAICLPVSVITQSLSILGEGKKYVTAKNIITSPEFAALSTMGFTRFYTDVDSKLSLSHPFLKATIKGYPSRLEIENGVARLIVDFNTDDFTDEQRKRMKEQIGAEKLGNDWLGVALIYKPARRKKLLSQDVVAELNQLISFLKAEGLNPWPQEEYPW